MRVVVVVSVVTAIALGSVSSPASAYAPCEPGDVQCYRTCYLPHYDKTSGFYWVNC